MPKPPVPNRALQCLHIGECRRGFGIHPARWKPDPHRLRLDGSQLTSFPTFDDFLLALDESGLAAQIPELRIVDRCCCGDGFCSTFYVQPRPDGAYGPGDRNVDRNTENGMLVLDVVGDRIAAVEVLYRDELREKVHALLP